MARRSKSTFKPIWIIAAVALVIVAFLGSSLFISTTGDPFRTYPTLDVTAYLDNANSLRSNVYKIEGEVLSSLAWSPSGGRLFAISVEKGNQVIPILITNEFNQVNIQKGQKFIFLLEVDDKGILRTKKLQKA